jgi:hypothetical protein
MVDLALQCSCGKVKGVVKGATASTGTRIVCFCADCQAFAHRLGKQAEILDSYGGTDIFQVVPAQISISQGIEYLNCLRLSAKGIYRWYTTCCHTPVANTVSVKLPFVGLIHNFINGNKDLDARLGPVRFYIHGKYALGEYDNPRLHEKVPFTMLLRIIPKLLLAKISGKGRPNPFYDANGRAISKPHIGVIEG